MEAVLDFGRGRQKWLNSAMGSMLSALLPFLFFNVSFAYFWLAVRLSLDKKIRSIGSRDLLLRG
jgi:hypothetical protein